MSNPPDLKRIFTIDIAEANDGYVAVVKSIQEEKAKIIKSANLRLLLAEVNRTVRKRRNHLLRFPAPPPSALVTFEESLVKPPRLIVPSNGN